MCLTHSARTRGTRGVDRSEVRTLSAGTWAAAGSGAGDGVSAESGVESGDVDGDGAGAEGEDGGEESYGRCWDGDGCAGSRGTS